MNFSAENIQKRVAEGYAEARELASSHYENFPVVSLFIKKELRDHVAVVYWFARTADDIADEGTSGEEERIRQLDDFKTKFESALSGNPDSALHAALLNTISEKKLKTGDFLALLSAFRQDVHKKRYATMAELLDYCSRSADPVGRIILDLHDIHDEEAKRESDSICTALQLANFWQDVSVDIKKGRIYVPEEIYGKYKIAETEFGPNTPSPDFKACMHELCNYTDALFESGKPLIKKLPRPLKFEIAWTVYGGKKILENLRKIDYTVNLERVTLTKVQFISAAIRAVLNG